MLHTVRLLLVAIPLLLVSHACIFFPQYACQEGGGMECGDIDFPSDCKAVDGCTVALRCRPVKCYSIKNASECNDVAGGCEWFDFDSNREAKCIEKLDRPSCDDLPEGECSTALGCTWLKACGGKRKRCSEAQTKDECWQRSGCSWRQRKQLTMTPEEEEEEWREGLLAE